MKFPVTIRFSDFDSFGHANNASYLTYLEEARVAYFEKVIGKGNRVDWLKTGIIMANAHVEFRFPISGYDGYFIDIRVSRMGKKSFEFAYVLTHEFKHAVKLIAEASTVMVCYDYAMEKTVELPSGWRELMQAANELSD
jgi:acyl-CoA thioester hydrolase